MEKEIWKDVVGYEGYYKVNQFGVVKSMERLVPQGPGLRHVKEKNKAINLNPYGYPYVTLCKNRKSKNVLLHIILAKAFIPNPENKPHVDHIDTNTKNYSLENLRWVTPKENANNPLTLSHCRQNTYSSEALQKRLVTRKLKGCNTAPKTVYQFDMCGKFIRMYDSINDAQRQTSVDRNTISLACKGKRYSAGGFLWSYNMDDKISYKVPVHTNAKKILQFDKKGNFIKEWESLAAVCKVYGSSPSNLSKRIVRGRFRGPYIWKFKPL